MKLSMTLFDRYLLRRFLSVFLILFLSTFGLFTVIDGFTNMDEFQSTGDLSDALQRIGEYYFLQTSIFLEMVGAILSIVSAMVVFAMLQKHSEIHPILAAGIPTYRLAVPILLGTLCVSAILAVNQELVIPRIAHLLQAPRKATDQGHVVEPIYDSNRIHIDGRQLHLASRQLSQAEFVLPAPELALELTTIRSTKATYHRADGKRPAGWLLNSARPTFDQLSLTDAGRRIVCSTRKQSDMFIITNASFDQLHNRNRSFTMVSTGDLIRRIKNPSGGLISVKSQVLHLHNRLTRPLVNLIGVLLVIPMIIRRGSRGLIGNMASCALLLGTFMALSNAFYYLGSASLIDADLAAWSPIICGGSLGAWLTGTAQS